MINPTSRPIHLCHGQPIAKIADKNIEVKDTRIMRNLNSHSDVRDDNSPNLLNSLHGFQGDGIISDFFSELSRKTLE